MSYPNLQTQSKRRGGDGDGGAAGGGGGGDGDGDGKKKDEKKKRKPRCGGKGDLCETTQPGKRSNSKREGGPDGNVACAGSGTADVRLREILDFSEYRVRSDCLSLPLKSGGSLNLRWNHLSGVNYSLLPMQPDEWAPGGTGAMFSFLPYLAMSSSDPQFTDCDRLSEDGLLRHFDEGTIGAITYYEPVNPSLYKARYDSGTKYFTEYDADRQVYFVFGGPDHPLYGRPIRRFDRNGNELLYHYADRDPNPASHEPLLRKITGDLSGVTPYFEYDDESAYPAPIIKMHIKDHANQAEDRTAYFEYQSTTDGSIAFLEKITHPGGCVKQYKLQGYYGDTRINKEQDAEGYTTYFRYNHGALRKTVEPEGRITYYNYGDYLTTVRSEGRGSARHKFDLSSGATGNIAEVRREADALNFATRYEWTYFSAGNSFYGDNVKRRVEANGNTTYYEYNAKASLAKEIRADDGATTQHEYEANGFDLHKTLGPRHAAGSFPVVTYYEYDGNRNRSAVVDPLGGKTSTAVDSAGRVRKERNARLNTTYFNYNVGTGNLDSTVDAEDGVAYFGYNSWRDRTREVSPRWRETGSYAGFTTYHEYDNLDRRTKSMDPLNGATYFDHTSRGDLSMRVDPRNVATYFEYNGLRLLAKRTVADAGGAEAAVEEYGYDVGLEQVSKWHDARGNTTYYAYDDEGQITRLLTPDGAVQYFTYDSLGNLAYRDITSPSPEMLVCTFAGTTRGTKGEEPVVESGDISYDASGMRLENRLNYDRAILSYDASKYLADGKGTICLRVRGDYWAWDAGQVLLQVDKDYETADIIYIHRIKDELRAGGNAGQAAQWRISLDTSGYSDDKDYDIVLVYDTDDVRFYVYEEGVLKASDSDTSATIPTGLEHLHVGCTDFDYLEWNGTIGRLMTFDRALTADEVAALVRGQLPDRHFYYDTPGRLKTARDRLGNDTYFFYDKAGNRTEVRDARLNTTYFFYDAADRLVATRDAVGEYAYFFYDAVGNQTEVRDARENATYFFYDKLDRTTAVRDALANHAYFFYDQNGNTTEVRDARENTAYFFYDKLDRMTSARDALANRTYFGYDAVGNLLKVHDARLNTAYFEYDALSRATKVIDQEDDVAYFAYDGVGNLTRVVDARFERTYFEYDPVNRLTEVEAPDTGTVGFAYDARGNRTREQDQLSQTTYYEYDAESRLVKLVDPLDEATYYAYDAVGNLTRRHDQEDRIAYFAYTARNERRKTAYSDGVNCYYTYDAVGNLTEMIDPAGTGRFVYDNVDRLSKREHPSSFGTAYFAYNEVGALSSLDYPSGSAAAYFDYDALNRLRKAVSPQDKTAYYTYDAGWNVTKETLGNAVDAEKAYDQANRVTSIKYHDGSTPLAYFEYSRGAGGMIEKVRQLAANSDGSLCEGPAYYSYDANSRLTREARGGWGTGPWGYFAWGGHTYFDYSYDKAGNRTRSLSGAGWSWTYYQYSGDNSLDRTFLEDLSEATYYEYDKTGAVEKIVQPDGTSYFEYAASGLVKKFAKTGKTFEFGYDAALQRRVIVEDGTPTYFLWDGLRLLETRNADGTLRSRLTHGRSNIEGIGTCVEIHVPSTSKQYYMLMDHRGSAYVLLDESKTVVATRLYNAFGEIITETGTWPDEVPFAYQSNWLAVSGMTLPDGTRLHLAPFRVYDPTTGRFLQRDHYASTGGDRRILLALAEDFTARIQNGSVDVQELAAQTEFSFLLNGRWFDNRDILRLLRGLRPEALQGGQWRYALQKAVDAVYGGSVYSYVGNSPLAMIDPDGRGGLFGCFAILTVVVLIAVVAFGYAMWEAAKHIEKPKSKNGKTARERKIEAAIATTSDECQKAHANGEFTVRETRASGQAGVVKGTNIIRLSSDTIDNCNKKKLGGVIETEWKHMEGRSGRSEAEAQKHWEDLKKKRQIEGGGKHGH